MFPLSAFFSVGFFAEILFLTHLFPLVSLSIIVYVVIFADVLDVFLQMHLCNSFVSITLRLLIAVSAMRANFYLLSLYIV
jgi:hypothetical protein